MGATGVGVNRKVPRIFPAPRYGSFRISQQGEITTEVLFVAVGLLVGELAARGRQHERAAARGKLEISRLHDLSQLIADGEEPEFVLIAVANELRLTRRQ